METISFEKLPEAVAQLHQKLENIERLLEEQSDQNNPKIQKGLLSVSEAAEFLNLAVPTVYSMVSRGEIPFMKRAKRLYFSSEELLEYVREGRQMTDEDIKDEAINNLKERRY